MTRHRLTINPDDARTWLDMTGRHPWMDADIAADVLPILTEAADRNSIRYEVETLEEMS